jgi:copper chaperone NosL
MKKILTLCLLILAACNQENTPSAQADSVVAKNVETETCSACGMVVREQPAPRGQVVYRDGSREFLCAIDDLVRFLEVPSPKGKPVKIFAEVMADGHNVTDMDASAKPWVEVDKLFFVTSIERGGVMGAPALTYQTEDAAKIAAAKYNGKVVTFQQLTQNK